MNIKRKPELNHVYVLGDDGFKKLDFQFLEEDFVLIFHDNRIIVPKELDESFYNNFSKLFDNSYVFRDKLSYKKEDEISWASDDYLEIDNTNDEYKRLIMVRYPDAIEFTFTNKDYNDDIPKGVHIVKFSPLGTGRYSRNIETGTSLQDDMISTFETILKDNTKKKSTK